MPHFKFDYDHFTFTLSIPNYWSEIYKGKPHIPLYRDYTVLLDRLKQMPKDRYVLDVGANHGIFSVPASMLGYKVIAFEPVKANFDSLLESCELNKITNIDLFQMALLDKEDMFPIYVPECPDNSSLSIQAAIANMKGKEYRIEKIHTVMFDKFVANNLDYRKVGFIKIDVQGAEYEVIMGMKNFLFSAVDLTIVVEMEDHLLKMGHTYEELTMLIKSLGFEDHGKIVGNDRLFIKTPQHD